MDYIPLITLYFASGRQLSLFFKKFQKMARFRRTRPPTPRSSLEGFAAGVAGLEIMPVFNVRFVFFPAEKDFLTVADGGKVDEAAIGVFDLNLAGGEFLEDVFAVGEGADEVVGR